jgi:type IX secretion system PorP/SprF family membrane protein
MRIKITKNQLTLVPFLLLILLAGRVKAQSQAFSYTQYMDNLTPLNPAYSLLDKANSVYLLGRKELVGINGSPATEFINVNAPIESITGAAGLTVLNDQFAIEHQVEANVYFAKAIQLGLDAYLGVSLNAGVRNYTNNLSSIDNNNDPELNTDIRQTKPNVGFGVMYFTESYYIGLSVPELTITSLGTAGVQDSENFRNHYYFAGGFITDLGEDIKIKPATLVSYVVGLPTTVDVSATFYLKEIIGFGVNYHVQSSANKAAGIITINLDSFHLGYSYAFNTGQNLGGINPSTNEVTLSYRFGRGANHPKLL